MAEIINNTYQANGKRKRLLWVDAVKGIAIIAVVLHNYHHRRTQFLDYGATSRRIQGGNVGVRYPRHILSASRPQLARYAAPMGVARIYSYRCDIAGVTGKSHTTQVALPFCKVKIPRIVSHVGKAVFNSFL